MVKQCLLILLPAHQVYGQERALISIAQIMRHEGVHTYFLTHAGWGKSVACYLTDLGFGSIPLPLGNLWSLSMARKEPKIVLKNAFSVVRSNIAFYKIVKKFNPDLLLTGNTTFTFYFLPALFYAKLKVIYRHGDDLVEHSVFHRILNWLIFRRVDKHVANCCYLGRIIANKYPNKDISVIHNCPTQLISINNYSAKSYSTVSDSLISHHKKILYIGQITNQKGVAVLLEAFQIVAAENPRWSLFMIGDVPSVDGPKENEVLKEIMRASGVLPGRVHYLGPKKDVGDYYQSADLHVCPSIYSEASPNVIFEAKYYSLPSVVFPVGGIPELIRHKVDGFVCKQIDAQSLAEGLRFFIEDDIIRASAAILARESLGEQFGLDRFRRQWADVLLYP